MIQLIDQALEQYLRATVPLPENAVDVSFVTPDKAWGKSITQPSVNLFLWDVKRSSPRSQSGRLDQTNDGTRFRRHPLPVIDLNYFVTAWAMDQSDEHQLLGTVLTTILGTGELPPSYVPEAFAELGPITVELATSAQRKPGDFVSVLDGQLKPGLEVRVSLEVEAGRMFEAGPPTDSIDINLAPGRMAAPPTPTPTLEERERPVRRRRQGSVVMEGRRESADPTP
jgi:hypothetical protein